MIPTPPNSRSYESHAEKCKGCGYNIHVRGCKQCLVWEKSCHKCGAEKHFSSVCRGTASSNCIKEDNVSHGQDECISFITTVNTQPPLWLDGGEGIPHGTWTDNRFTPVKQEPPPFIGVKVAFNATAHRKLVQSTKRNLEPFKLQL